jgi:glucose/arabinose dehydrogenase
VGRVRLLAVVGPVVVALVLAGGPGSANAAESAFRRAVLVRGLESPVDIATTPSEPYRLYVVEQRGTIRVVERGKLKSGFVLDMRGGVSEGDEQGLLGLALDPRYAKNRLLYINYTDVDGDTRVVRYKTKGLRVVPASRRDLLRVEQPYSNHNGGGLVFGPDGLLYVGLGDGGSAGDPQHNAQNPASPLGKMLRLDVRRPGSAPQMVALGLRNPWRYSFDRLTGDLYIGDVGQGALEEVDFTPARSPGLENYGWNLWEGTQRYESGQQGPGKIVAPVHEYSHDRGGCSVVGGFVYRGKARAAEVGRYLFGDYCTGEIWSLRMRNGEATAVRREPFRVPSLTSFGEDPAGELYALSRDGVVYRLT